MRRGLDESGTLAVGAAGTYVVADWSILHRRAVATASGINRHMMKMSFWRTAYPPRRDWINTPRFELRTAEYGFHDFGPDKLNWIHGSPVSQGERLPTATDGPGSLHFLDRYIASKLFWLWGEPAPSFKGGPCWPAHYGGDGGHKYGWPPTSESTPTTARDALIAHKKLGAGARVVGELAVLREEVQELKALLLARL